MTQTNMEHFASEVFFLEIGCFSFQYPFYPFSLDSITNKKHIFILPKTRKNFCKIDDTSISFTWTSIYYKAQIDQKRV